MNKMLRHLIPTESSGLPLTVVKSVRICAPPTQQLRHRSRAIALVSIVSMLMLSTSTADPAAAAGRVAVAPEVAPAAVVTNAHALTLSASPTTIGLALSWSVPVDAQGAPIVPDSYTVDISPSVVPSQTLPGTATSLALNSATLTTCGATFTITLTQNFAPPALGASASALVIVPCGGLPGELAVAVIRAPVYGLVLTQRCGVYGALPAEPASIGFPSLPPSAPIGTVDPNNANLLVGGTAPVVAAGGADPSFPQYPLPVDAAGVPSSPPTTCGLSLGTAELVSAGPEAGKYFRAMGRLNEITLIDVRNVDDGWTLQAEMTDFQSATSADTFTGNLLGWTPVRNFDSGLTLEAYDMITTAGDAVAPASPNGLGSSPKILGSAARGQGLGQAVFDARLRLLIPVTKDSGNYTAKLTVSAI